jgi:signal transduction histidine kinase/CheY-like chemotaxis protein
MVGAIRDITSLREAQTKRVDLEARLLAERNNALLASRLQHAQRMESLGLLAGGIAHDFNNLLVGVLGYADLALNELGPTSPARPLIEEARKSGERAADLCNQMLAYSGRGKFLVENIDLNDIVEDIRQLLEMVISKKVALQHKCSSGIPSISADETQIRQVIMNLVINASEAIGDESGVIAIATGAMECDRAYLDLAYVPAADAKEGNYIYVEVSDTGCGLDAAALDRIFDPFFTTKMTGRGLGLAAVLGIIRSHGGAIKVYSEPGAGTTIKVLFPAIDEPAPNRPTRTGSHEKWRGDGTILLVDDDETVLKIARIMLEEAGFRVRTAANGLEGLEVFAAHTEEITCVVLDLMMPQMDGSEAFREMRRLRPNVRVVLSSGYSDYDVTARFAGQGLAGFLKKPYRSSQLLEVVLAAIEA